MQNRGILTVLSLVSVLPVACGDGEVRWAGTISDSAGITIVSNTDVGLWAPGDEWTPEEELRIGALEGAPEYQFGLVGSIAVDSKGSIYVLDALASVTGRADLGAPDWDVFDAQGRFLGVVTLPQDFAPKLFREDKIYGVWRDELDVQYVIRLRIVGAFDAGA